jgi:Baseplate J-like protein
MFRRARVVPRSQELVFLDADDDLGTIRSKLESTSAEEMYLVIPRRSPVLRTPLEFRILARIANEMSSETIVVTDDGARRRLAEQEGFQTRRSLRTLKHLMVAPGQRAPRFVLPDWVPVPSFSGFLTTLGLVVLAALIAVVVLPVMHVTLVPQTNSIERNLDITADPDTKTPDPASGSLPAEVMSVTIDEPGSLPVSDRKVGQDKAHGEVLVTSKKTSTFTLPKGTIVRTADGVRFVTDQDQALAAYGQARVGITAEQPGVAGNVDAGQITELVGPNLDDLTVTNQRPTSGGTDRDAKVVTADDQTMLRTQIINQAQKDGFAQLKQKAGPDRTLPDATLKVAPNPSTEHFDQAPGAEAEQLTGRISVTVTGTAFNNLAFNDLVGRVLEASAGSSVHLTEPPTVGVPGVLKVEGQKVVLRVQAKGTLQSDINGQRISEALRGSTAQDARSYLARLGGLAEPPIVDLSPSWAPRAFRVDVNVRGAS